MDPDLVYSRHRDDALAKQFEAKSYSTFVAMPFRTRFSYRSTEIYREVFQAAAKVANQWLDADPEWAGFPRFQMPRRNDDQPQTSRDIGGDIVKSILYSHFVLGDLTFANDGVLLEVGAALALKPTSHIILVTQGNPADLHFDIQGNAVISYRDEGDIEVIADALLAAATDFESRRREYLTHLSRELSRDAIWLMNWYGRVRTGKLRVTDPEGQAFPRYLNEDLGRPAFLHQTSSHAKAPADVEQTTAMVRYQLASRELLNRRLMWSDYRTPSPQPGGDSYSSRGTRLGWMFIEKMWPDLKCPADEFED